MGVLVKVKKYEAITFITVLSFLVFIFEICSLTIFSRSRITDYFQLSSLVTDKNEIRLIVDGNERKALYDNSVLYIDDKKIPYSIKIDNGVLWQKEKTKYYEIILKLKLKKKYNLNDIVVVSLTKEKVNLIKAIIKTWGGD